MQKLIFIIVLFMISTILLLSCRTIEKLKFETNNGQKVKFKYVGGGLMDYCGCDQRIYATIIEENKKTSLYNICYWNKTQKIVQVLQNDKVIEIIKYAHWGYDEEQIHTYKYLIAKEDSAIFSQWNQFAKQAGCYNQLAGFNKISHQKISYLSKNQELVTDSLFEYNVKDITYQGIIKENPKIERIICNTYLRTGKKVVKMISSNQVKF